MDDAVFMPLEPPKRARDGDLLISSLISDRGPVNKRFCSGLEIKDAIISSIMETDTDGDGDADGFYQQSELDEDRKRLVFGVMKSLEEELGVSADSDVSPAPSAEEMLTSLTDQDACWFDLRYQDISSSGSLYHQERHSCKAVTEHAEFQDLPKKPESEAASSSCTDRKKVDIGYLLEASDDELGISPSPGSESTTSEADLFLAVSKEPQN